MRSQNCSKGKTTFRTVRRGPGLGCEWATLGSMNSPLPLNVQGHSESAKSVLAFHHTQLEIRSDAPHNEFIVGKD